MRKWAVDPKLMILSVWSLSDVTEGTQRLSQVSEIIPSYFVRSSWTGSLVFVPLQTCGRQNQVSVLSGSKTRLSFQEAVSTGLIYDLCIECPLQSFWMLEWLWDLCYFFFLPSPNRKVCIPPLRSSISSEWKGICLNCAACADLCVWEPGSVSPGVD